MITCTAMLGMPRRWRIQLTKRLFDYNPRVIRWVIDDCWNDEVPRRPIVVLATDSNFLALLLDLVKETLDTLILHRVLDRPMRHAFVKAAANLQCFDLLNQRFAEPFID